MKKYSDMLELIRVTGKSANSADKVYLNNWPARRLACIETNN